MKLVAFILASFAFLQCLSIPLTNEERQFKMDYYIMMNELDESFLVKNEDSTEKQSSCEPVKESCPENIKNNCKICLYLMAMTDQGCQKTEKIYCSQ